MQDDTWIAGYLDMMKDYQNKIQKIHNEIWKNIYISDVIIWMRREWYNIDDIICVIWKLDKGDELKAVDEWSISSIWYVYSLIK